ncbi:MULTISPECIES: acyl-CoA synthetase [unclassified Haematobacter]|uniref:acyl-CoA synthetase n=1 Tax=unclassified Haematobacter TaxID=2640585 RepID=UPI0025BBA5A4|nr:MULTISPECIES: AMP-binding protein [unclassified Haematobacter]
MLVPPMTNYCDHVRTYTRPADPPTFNYAAVLDRYAEDPTRQAVIWTNEAGEERRWSFADLSQASQRIANVLLAQGVRRGDRVLVQLPRIPEWLATMFAIFRIGAVALPSLTMLQPKDLAWRIGEVGPKAVVTLRGLTAKYDGLLTGDIARLSIPYGPGKADSGWTDLAEAMAAASPIARPEEMRADEGSLIFFTSGSSGMPKGVVHSAFFAWGFHEISGYWFDFAEQRRDDLCWGTADTAWGFSACGTLCAPLFAGICVFIYDGPFDPKERLRLMEKYGVTHYAAAASEYRWMLGEDVAAYDLSRLRLSITAGDSLDAPTARRWMTLSGTRFHEAYGQTESFMTVGNFNAAEIRPGAMGLPMPGIPVDIIGDDCRPLPAGEIGDVAILTPYRGLMLGYWNDPERTEACFRTDAEGRRWFITGDRGRKDEDGYFWYEGRADDVINATGYRIGPTEVESVVQGHPAVLECAAVPSPDEKRGEVVKAYVVLNPGYAPSDDLVREIQVHVKANTAPYKYPRKIEFIAALPKTESGKVKRRELRDREFAKGAA